MEVNNELEEIESGVVQAIELLKKGGRLVIISFHSKEDRLIKNVFAKFAKGCICPKEFPQCLCHQKPKLKILTKKPITPTTKELEINIRSHSAKMRVGVRI
jgi:16S rRNA (cytosine1402-N4)-methyltransferase